MDICRLRAQVGIRSRVTVNIQVPNTAGIDRARAVQDMGGRNAGEDGVQVT
jgi:hypothetical protein